MLWINPGRIVVYPTIFDVQKNNPTNKTFGVEAHILHFFYIFHLNLYCRWRSNYQKRGDVGISLTDLTPPDFAWCPKLGTGLPTSCHTFFFEFKYNGLRWRCMSFCWYWWNCWLSMFKLIFLSLKQVKVIHYFPPPPNFLRKSIKKMLASMLYVGGGGDRVFDRSSIILTSIQMTQI